MPCVSTQGPRLESSRTGSKDANQLSLQPSERQKEETLEYFINSSAQAFESWHTELVTRIYFPPTQGTSKMTMLSRRLVSSIWYPPLFLSSQADLPASYLEILQKSFNLSFEFHFKPERKMPQPQRPRGCQVASSWKQVKHPQEIQGTTTEKGQWRYSTCIFNMARFN